MGVFTNTRRIVKAGFVNFWRNAVVSLSAIFVMTVALFVVGATMLSSVFLESSLNDIRDKVDINVYFNIDAGETEILDFKKNLMKLPEVKDVEYISRDQAIENFKTRHANDYLMTQALEELAENPLGAILNVKAGDPSQYEAIAKHIQDEQAAQSTENKLIYSVNYGKNKVVIDKLTQIISGVQKVSAAILLVLIAIAIMRLVGANNSFVRGPFIVEGMIYGMIASIISVALFYPVTLWLKGATNGFYGGIDLFYYYITNINQIFFVLLGTGVILGAISSFLAVRRYLKV